MKILRIIFIAGLLHMGISASGQAQGSLTNILSGKPIHPKVFNMLCCFISDVESPVVTGVNLEAVPKDRNQFDYAKVHFDGEWIIFDDQKGSGTCAYKSISETNGSYRIMYRENGGGSLTTVTYITFRIESRTIRRNDRNDLIRNLVVTGIADN